MPVTGLIFGIFILAIISAVAGFLTRRSILYAVALTLGFLAILMSIGLAYAISRM